MPIAAMLFAVLALSPALAAQVRITEFMASNDNTIEDEDGDSPDWIEVHNGTAAAVDLGGWYLSDDSSNLVKWAFPAPTVLQPDEYIVVFASDKDRAVSGQELHTNFKLKSEGEYLALVESDGVTKATEFAPQYPEQYEDVSFGFGGVGAPPSLSYFPVPTPGSANGPAGPYLADVQHNPEQPTASDDLLVTTSLKGDLGTSGFVKMHYRVMYMSTTTVPMYDDGTHGDLVAGDGVFTSTIPSSTFYAGEMVRYILSATDTNGISTRAPLFADPLDSPEYFGTMVQAPAVSSPLKIYYWFVEDPAAARTLTGTRCSVWYDGAFYDNVFVRRRGQTSAYWTKRNYKFDFNRGDHFRFDPNEGKVEEFNLNSTWSDKAFIRRVLSWETYRDAGAHGSICFPMRVQQNNDFFSVAAFVEQPDGELLERISFDPDGALYKMFNQLTSAYYGVEKKTRLWEDHQDLEDLVNGVQLTGTALERYLFDNIDVPAVISYIAATTIIHDNDHVAKNYYLYRDSDGDQEWMFLPWDKDLTVGRNYTLQGGVLNDTMWADKDPYSHPLFGDSDHKKVDGPWNRLIDACHDTPRIREMYLRRLRTVMDDLLQDPSTPASELKLETRIQELHDLMEDDVALDEAKWGIPTWGTLNLNFDQALNQLVTGYLQPRRPHLFDTHSTPQGGIIPGPQTASPSIGFGVIEADPASGNQAEDFIELVNHHATAVDISGWRLEDGIDLTFAAGTVIGPQDSLHASPSIPAFRDRATGPSGGQGLLVVGPWQGELEPWEDLVLRDAAGDMVNTTDGPFLSVRDLVAGELATVHVAGATPFKDQGIGYSLTGNGPTNTPYGILDLSPPIRTLAVMKADSVGVAVYSATVPVQAAGLPIWFQSVDLYSGGISNPIATVIH